VLLSLPLQFGEDHSYAIQISEQYLGLMFDSSDSQEFLVCNWKTGEIKLVSNTSRKSGDCISWA
jgi:hypothetical protein